MKRLYKYEEFERMNEEFVPVEAAYNLPDLERPVKVDKKLLKLEYIKEIGKKGELLNYIEKKPERLKFGILRALFNDAIDYKKKRELTKGTYKFFHRAIPIILAGVAFPVWVVAQVLGGSRALNKILVPVLKMNPSNYKNFLVKIIIKTMGLMEGEIKSFLGSDWYYQVFMVDWGLIRMIRKEHIYNFALHVSTIMEKEPDNKVVPKYYIENEMRKYLNDKFNLSPPLPPKTEDSINEGVDYSIYKNQLSQTF